MNGYHSDVSFAMLLMLHFILDLTWQLLGNMEMKREAFTSFSSLGDNFNVRNLRTQDTTSSDKLTTFTLEGDV